MIILRKHSTTTLPFYFCPGRVEAIFPSFCILGAREFFCQLFLTLGGQNLTIAQPQRKI